MSETQKSEPQMCKNCLRFYGNPQYDWLCSKCYKYDDIFYEIFDFFFLFSIEPNLIRLPSQD